MKHETNKAVFPAKTTFWRSRVMTAAVLASLCFIVPASSAQKVTPAPGTVFVNTALGGFILGYDIDRNGTEGILAEALTLNDGRHSVAVETFDQKTGKILKILTEQDDSNNDFVVLGVDGTSVGLIEFEKTSGGFVSQRLFGTVNPVSSNRLTGTWTPPLTKNQLLGGVANNQGSNNTAVLISQNFTSSVFGSDVAANTFGPVFPLAGEVFGFNHLPQLGIDSSTNQAIVVSSDGGIFDNPQIAEVDLTTGNTAQFTGLGFGSVNGLAVDSAKHLACTTSEIDFSLEIYDLANQFSLLIEPLQGATNQLQAGGAVAFDPIHKLFLIGQEFSSVAPSGSSIHVYNEQGVFVKAINGLSLPASPAYMALNPTKRIGYVIVTPNLNQLQQFSY